MNGLFPYFKAVSGLNAQYIKKTLTCCVTLFLFLAANPMHRDVSGVVHVDELAVEPGINSDVVSLQLKLADAPVGLWAKYINIYIINHSNIYTALSSTCYLYQHRALYQDDGFSRPCHEIFQEELILYLYFTT